MTSTGLLGDTVSRDYSEKLKLFNSFAKPELLDAIKRLGIKPGMRVLDAGCGTGENLELLYQATSGTCSVVGIDLAARHIGAARAKVSSQALVIQGDILRPPFLPASFDQILSINTINHLREPLVGLSILASLLERGGRIALGLSSMLPDMFFAWDSRLERLTTEAVRQYYRERYQLDERQLTSMRSLVGMLRRMDLCNVSARTFVIERVSPLRAEDEEYLVRAIFRDTWNERLQPYMPPDDYLELTQLCDPGHEKFALRRPDFHFMQTFTLAVGEVR
jgi:SAM-dependent methyltransferase